MNWPVNFIQRLQSLDEASKKIWLWSLSLAVFGLILFSWAGYLYYASPYTATTPASLFSTTTLASSEDISVWSATRQGLALAFNYAASLFNAKREVVVTHPSTTLDRPGSTDNITLIPPRTFPISSD